MKNVAITKILFLDIDGVLNIHRYTDGNCLGIEKGPVKQLNRLLKAHSDLKIVISSAWRYHILDGYMTLIGFEHMLRSHGLNVQDRLIGYTGPSEDLNEINRRSRQIKEWLTSFTGTPGIRYAVLDDRPVRVPHLFQTIPSIGLSETDVAELIAHYKNDAITLRK